jgi:diguanylate cyclase (GGDEF)-like protein
LHVLGLPDEVLDELAERGGVTPAGAGGTALQSQVSELERLALTDDLTGIASRRHWLQTVRSRLEDGERGGVVLLDIDHFKAINDTHGHQAGDLVLCEVARIAARHGFAGRLGGDELVVWVADEPSAAAEVAERLVREVRGSGHGEPLVTVSAGAAGAHDAQTGLSELLAGADEALYTAKRGGRDRASATAGAHA